VTTLNPAVWLPHYLPAWSSRSATAASLHPARVVRLTYVIRLTCVAAGSALGGLSELGLVQ